MADRSIKVVMLGDTSVGKSCLAHQFVKNEYKPHAESTIGASFMTKTVEIPLESFIQFRRRGQVEQEQQQQQQQQKQQQQSVKSRDDNKSSDDGKEGRDGNDENAQKDEEEKVIETDAPKDDNLEQLDQNEDDRPAPNAIAPLLSEQQKRKRRINSTNRRRSLESCASMSSILGGDSLKRRIEFRIWDTAGQERYHSLAPLYYRNARAAILVFDLCNRHTFQRSLKKWVHELEENGPGDELVLVICGNKADLAAPEPTAEAASSSTTLDSREQEEQQEGRKQQRKAPQRLRRQVPQEEAQQYAKEINAYYIETSAKDNWNVQTLFEQIALRLPESFYLDDDTNGNNKREDPRQRNGGKGRRRGRGRGRDDDNDSINLRRLSMNQEDKKACCIGG